MNDRQACILNENRSRLLFFASIKWLLELLLAHWLADSL